MWWAAKSPAGPGFTRVGGRAGGVGQLFAVDLGDGSVRGGAVDDQFLGDVGPEFRSWWACGGALMGRWPLWSLGFRGL